MKETLIKFEKSKISGKKYTAYIQNKATKKIRKIHFGASDYEQYKDRTPLKLYSHKNHNAKTEVCSFVCVSVILAFHPPFSACECNK